MQRLAVALCSLSLVVAMGCDGGKKPAADGSSPPPEQGTPAQPETPPPADPSDPQTPADPETPTDPSAGEPGATDCDGEPCAPPRECISYYGIAGPRGPEFFACEIRCKGGAGKGGCPDGMTCVTIADGPGEVCRAST
ncbi:MAG: hypothetical protein AAF799_17310 [Myxococcota bacterium]